MLNIKNREILGLWAISLLLIIPFNISKRIPPYTSFYEDTTVILFVLAIFFILIFTRRISLVIPRGTIFFLFLAAYWQLQPLFVDLPYPSQSTRVALFFVLMAMLFWAMQALLIYYQRDKVVKWVAFAILIGSLIQVGILLLQLTGWACVVEGKLYKSRSLTMMHVMG